MSLGSLIRRHRFMLAQRGLDQRQYIGAGRDDGVKPEQTNSKPPLLCGRQPIRPCVLLVTPSHAAIIRLSDRPSATTSSRRNSLAVPAFTMICSRRLPLILIAAVSPRQRQNSQCPRIDSAWYSITSRAIVRGRVQLGQPIGQPIVVRDLLVSALVTDGTGLRAGLPRGST